MFGTFFYDIIFTWARQGTRVFRQCIVTSFMSRGICLRLCCAHLRLRANCNCMVLHGQHVCLQRACHPRICASILAAVCFLGGFHTFLVTDLLNCGLRAAHGFCSRAHECADQVMTNQTTIEFQINMMRRRESRYNGESICCNVFPHINLTCQLHAVAGSADRWCSCLPSKVLPKSLRHGSQSKLSRSLRSGSQPD